MPKRESANYYKREKVLAVLGMAQPLYLHQCTVVFDIAIHIISMTIVLLSMYGRQDDIIRWLPQLLQLPPELVKESLQKPLQPQCLESPIVFYNLQRSFCVRSGHRPVPEHHLRQSVGTRKGLGKDIKLTSSNPSNTTVPTVAACAITSSPSEIA